MLTRPFLAVFAAAFLAVCGPLLKNASGIAGLPNWLPLVRDPLIIAVACLGIARVSVFDDFRWRWLLLWLLLFVFTYMGVSLYQDRAIVGLYYLRLYLLPILFGIGVIGLMARYEKAGLAEALLKLLLSWNLLLFIVALGIYILLLEVPQLRPSLFGSELLPTAWYISGGTWMRMGLPAAGPNGLGLVFALHALLLLVILVAKPSRPSSLGNAKLAVHLGLALIGLMLTFSRSSMLLFILGGLILVILPGVLSFARLIKLFAASLLGLLLLVAIGYGFDLYSDGYVERWLTLNFQGRDPSALGHMHSVRDALDRWAEYALVGYDRGTVGPKAQLFTGIFNNVESSWLGLLYDMGLVNSLPYVLCISTMLFIGYVHRGQLAVLIGLAAPFALLPYIFEADAVLYAFFIYLLLGYFLKNIESSANVAREDRLGPYFVLGRA